MMTFLKKAQCHIKLLLPIFKTLFKYDYQNLIQPPFWNVTHARPEKQLRLIWYCWEHRACSDMHRHCWCLSASFKLHKVFFNASPSRGAMYLLKCILPLVDQKSNPSSFIWDADCHCLPKKISLSKMFLFLTAHFTNRQN